MLCYTTSVLEHQQSGTTASSTDLPMPTCGELSQRDHQTGMKEEANVSERKSRGTSAQPHDEAPKGAWAESAARGLRERYLTKDERGSVIETPDEMCWRVARAIASAEGQNSGKSPEEIERVAAGYAHMMLSRRFMPNSPT